MGDSGRIPDADLHGLRTRLGAEDPAECEPPGIIGSGTGGLDQPARAQVGPDRLSCHRTPLKVGDLDNQGIRHGIVDDTLLALPGDDRD